MEEIKKLICDTVNPWLKILPVETHEEFTEKFMVLINEMHHAQHRHLVETIPNFGEGRD
tara:strand:+ start:1339 stop:1515 length:177 start_codon:yes stop_codon:yes gene_type:complete